jgi:hypothetical protein
MANGITVTMKNIIANILCSAPNIVTENAVSNINNIADALHLGILKK